MGTQGGARRGAGRPRKSDLERALDGNAGHRGRPPQLAELTDRGRVLQHPTAGAKALPAAEVVEPAELTPEERGIWRELAPHAIAANTLGPATAFAFRRLCTHIVLERRFAVSVKDAGSAGHRALIRLVDIELSGFQLAPFGNRPTTVAPAAPAEDPLESKYF